MLDPTRYEAISIDQRDDGVVLATLNRPDRLNAVNAQMHHELAWLTRDVDADPAVRVLVITGAGRAFCAGGDFGPQPATSDPGMTLEEGRQIVDHLLECSKPVISAVNGYAMGLGATVALLCDVVYAAESAVFADTHVKMGIGAGDGGQVIWPLLMGVNKAKYFLMTGDRLTAAEAERMNLVNFVVARRHGRRRGPGPRQPPRRRPGRGDLGVEDGDQQLDAVGVERRAAAVARPRGRLDALVRPPRGRQGLPGEARPRRSPGPDRRFGPDRGRTCDHDPDQNAHSSANTGGVPPRPSSAASSSDSTGPCSEPSAARWWGR